MPAAWGLARSGAADITIIDPDPVELSNLARQVLYRDTDIGTLKVSAAARRLRALYPQLHLNPIAAFFDRNSGAKLVVDHDFIIDGTDDPAVKFLINDLACDAGRPFTYGGVLGMAGQVMTVLPGDSACLRCLFENPPNPDEAASCRDAGIIGPVAAVIGEIQAAEALAFVRGERPQLAGRMLAYDMASSARLRISAVAARRGCRCRAAAHNRASANFAPRP